MSLVAWYAGLGVAQAAVGAWVVVAQPRRLLSWAVGSLLILWSGSGVVFQLMREATDPALFVLYNRIGSYYELPTFLLVLLIADRALLREPRPRWRIAVLGAAALFLLLAWSVVLFGQSVQGAQRAADPSTGWPIESSPTLVPLLASNLTIACMAAAVFLAARAAGEEDRTLLARRQAALVGLAFGLLIAQNTGGHVASALADPSGAIIPSVHLLARVVAVASLVPLAYALLALPRPFARTPRHAVRAALAAALLAGALGRLAPELFGRYGSRVIVVTGFALTLAVAVLRYDLAAPDAQRRARQQRTASAVLAFAAAAVAAGAVVSVSGPTPVRLGVAAAAAVAPLALLAIPGSGASAWLARRVLLDPRDPDVLRERVLVYARTLRAATGPDGRVPEATEPALAALRSQLGLSRRDHELLLALGDTRDARGLVAYRLALEDGQGDEARLRGIRQALGVSEQDHARVVADVRGDRGLLTEGALAFGRYLVVGRLGEGGFGEVWRARDRRLSRDVVLKRLTPGDARDARALRRIQSEVSAAGALQHPHIVTVHDVETLGPHTYLVMEHVPGGSLADALRASPRLPEDEVVRVGLDILSALAALHARGIVHRDVKPANILLDGAGRAKLADFTLAREIVSGETLGAEARRGPVGTFPYLPPEQARGLTARAPSDLYSLGATLYEAVAGRPVLALDGLSHDEAARRVVLDAPALPVPHASPALGAAIAKALAKAPEDRFASAEEMAAALAPAATRAGTPEGSGPRPRRPPA